MPGRRPEVAIPCVMPRSRSSCSISFAPGSGRRSSGGSELAEQPVVDALQLLRLLVAQLVADLAADGAREQAAAHPDLAVDAPAVDGHPALLQGLLPREDVGVDGVDERAVEVEDECRHVAVAG